MTLQEYPCLNKAIQNKIQIESISNENKKLADTAYDIANIHTNNAIKVLANAVYTKYKNNASNKFSNILQSSVKNIIEMSCNNYKNNTFISNLETNILYDKQSRYKSQIINNNIIKDYEQYSLKILNKLVVPIKKIIVNKFASIPKTIENATYHNSINSIIRNKVFHIESLKNYCIGITEAESVLAINNNLIENISDKVKNKLCVLLQNSIINVLDVVHNDPIFILSLQYTIEIITNHLYDGMNDGINKCTNNTIMTINEINKDIDNIVQTAIYSRHLSIKANMIFCITNADTENALVDLANIMFEKDLPNMV
jgi:hypothetical protein